MAPDRRWPAAPAIYEIYTRSFRDTTGSGEGDLRGVIEGLDHVASLGVDAIWLAPFYPSPRDDGGYDVADHRAVDPRYGTMEDFDALVARAHDLGLRVMIDLVLNHTSVEHRWFRSAVEDDDSACADRYIWRDPKPDGTPPNNWQSYFGGSAWSWNHRRRQYYLHQFLSCQPNLDLRHPDVIAEHERTVRFWRDRGADGFRLDAVTCYLSDPTLRDNPPARPEVARAVSTPDFVTYSYQDHVHDMLPGDGGAYMETVRGWAGDDCWLMGENNSGNQSVELSHAFTQPGRLDACYTVDMVEMCATADQVADYLDRIGAQRTLPWWMTSHDQPRGNTSWGDGSWASARFLMLLLCVMPGPVLLYQGDELGLPQPDLRREEVTDPFDLRYWPDGPGREGPRVPLPWGGAAPGWGFTSGTPWLPMRWSAEHAVDRQDTDPDSPLRFARHALAWRRETGIAAPARFAHRVENGHIRLDIEAADGRGYRVRLNMAGGERVDVPETDAPVIASAPVDGGLGPLSGAVWATG